jgi:DNA-binding NarL/FixJ family response regulator
MKKIKVIIVDAQILFLQSLQIVLETHADDIAVVGVASNGKIALQLAETEQPDVVLMEILIPEMGGIAYVGALKERFPQIKVLILTSFADNDYVVQALHFGAAGYLLKDMSPQDLILTIRTVYQGKVTIAPQIASKLAERLFQIDYGNPIRFYNDALRPAWLKSLNDKEQEILRLLTKGYDNKEIAARLYFAEQTVKNYVSLIYEKLGVHDRVRATLLARQAGLE